MLPTSTNVKIQVQPKIPANAEAVAVFVTQGAKDAGDAGKLLGAAERSAVARLLASGVSKGKAREVHFDLIDRGKSKPFRLYVVGLGEEEKLTAEAFRQSAGALAKAVRKHKLSRVAVVPPGAAGDASHTLEAIGTGFLLASFHYDEYQGTAHKDGKNDEAPKQIELTLVAGKGAVEPLARAQAIADAQNFARTIATRPGNDINPPALAKVAQQAARETGLSVRVLDEKQLTRLGMGGILGVGAGSKATVPPRLIALEHRPRGIPASRKPLLLVGKAITFDTGGISIKPAEKMQRMIFDKCGAMAVLGAMIAIAKLKLPVPVVGLMSSAENHISATAYRPGDILTMYNGVTVEVTNTDAEGRLVLGDALAWGIETYKPAAVVDLATLTGGVVVALGKTMAGVMSNDDGIVAELTLAGESAGEKIWRLPVGDEHREQMKSDFADIVNSAGREAHPLQGAAFLSFFVPRDNSVPWAHLDIAGVADTEKDLPYYAKGATGWGVRTLVNWVAGKVKK